MSDSKQTRPADLHTDKAGHALGLRLFIVFASMFAAQAIGSAFNIWYNLTHIVPLLKTSAERNTFETSITWFNLVVYPPLVLWWAWLVWRLHQWPRDSEQARRRVVNLPWLAALVASIGWLLCIPALMYAMREVTDRNVLLHLPVSILIGAFIALAQSFLAVDLLSQKLLYAYFFDATSPWKVRGAHSLSLTGRGIFWTVSAGVCPILSMLLLILTPPSTESEMPFAIAVAVCIWFGLSGAWLLSRLVVEPVNELRRVAQEVGRGNLETSVEILRADEFGILADEFNSMIAGLRQKEHMEGRVGRALGPEIVQQLLRREEELGGVERQLSVLFSDIRGYTSFCAELKPDEALTVLNAFHATMTRTITEHGGIVNQLVGDGMMAIFGAIDEREDHAEQAIAAGLAMLQALPELNHEIRQLGHADLRIGVGINSGMAIVGTIGSPGRMEFTAVGDVVNVAARIESLTKEHQSPLLFSPSTLALLPEPLGVVELPPLEVRGKREPLVTYTFESLKGTLQ